MDEISTEALVGEMRAHVRYEYMPAAARVAMHLAADRLEALESRALAAEARVGELERGSSSASMPAHASGEAATEAQHPAGWRIGPETELELRARACVLQNQLDAITGTDIAHVRHSDGGVDLARRFVNLKNAADWLLHYVAGALPEVTDASVAAAERSEAGCAGKEAPDDPPPTPTRGEE